MYNQEKNISIARRSDRRKVLVLPPFRYFLEGRRLKRRRQADKKGLFYVDAIPVEFIVLTMGILVMSALDGFFTLFHISNGASELNPLMDTMLQVNERYFFVIKYSITSVGIFVLCVYNSFFPTRKILSVIFLLYFIVLLYHISLIRIPS
ncbi:MAG: DUF5658 family protein [Nitrospinota bacterium]